MQDFRKLKAWQRAQEACVRVYHLTADFPPEERYGLSSQLRDAAVSVGANLAEGSKRATRSDKARFFNYAHSSSAEIMSELDVALRLGYRGAVENTALGLEYDEIASMIYSLWERVRPDNPAIPSLRR
jgi:four helix bundle protein